MVGPTQCFKNAFRGKSVILCCKKVSKEEEDHDEQQIHRGGINNEVLAMGPTSNRNSPKLVETGG